jgi:hypothetical protein
MRTVRALFLVGTLFALTLSLAGTVVAAISPSAGQHPQEGALAVVLLPDLAGTRLVVVDLERHAVVRRIRLRSLVTDIEADPASVLLIGAQSGGVADRADDAVSLVDPRSGRVRYVRLPWGDPVRVACVGGKAFVLHAIVETQGLAVSVVDAARGSVTATGHAPDGPGVWSAAAGQLWTVAASPLGSWSLIGLEPETLATGAVTVAGIVPLGVEDAGGLVAVLGRPEHARPPTGGALALFDSSAGSVVASATAPDLRHGARMAAAAGPWLVVGDWSGEAPETQRLDVFDRRTLAPAPPIELDAVPCAIAASGGHLLAVDRIGGRLLEVDPASGAVTAAVDLGARDLIYSDIAVIPGVAARSALSGP